MNLIISLLLGYLLGCIQTPYIVVKHIKRVDIREYGSKNAGASNATRILGFKYGILIGIIDILKAVLAVVIIKYVYHDTLILMLAAGTACILGHIYPVFLSFKGGKGVATTVGTLLAVDVYLGISAVLILIVVTLITNRVALGSIMVYVLLPVSLYFLHYEITAIIFGIFISILGIFKHSGNIRRILNGTENTIFRR